jgi:hypothetical protein
MDKTLCLSCETVYNKNIFLFDYCPICKGKNLKQVVTIITGG